VSRDGGATWTEVAGNMPGAPDGSYISRIEASRAGPGVAYVAVDNHRRGDFSPYAYRTEDFGRTWTSIAAGLPADGSVRFIGEHPDRAGVLFLGTEHALWVSPDKGATWYPLGRDMPATLYMEVEVQPRTHDAVVATHGRSLYILDAASSVAEWTPAVAREPAHLFSVSPSHIWQYWEDYSYEGQDFYAGENPPDGAILDYTLGQAAPAATLTVTNADGDVVRTLTGPGGAGVIHRVVWDLRHDPPPTQPEDPNSPQAHALPRPPRPLTTGPWVSPGTYTVTLKAGNAAAKQTVRVQGDPGKPALTEAQYRARERFLVELLKVQKAAYERLGGPNASPAARRVFFGVSSLAGDFNGSGSVQGSLYPPTPEQRRRLEELKAQLAPGGM